jgi:hypothetical protein
MKKSFEHGLSQERAKKVTQHAIDRYTEKFSKYNPEAEWVSDTRAEVSFSAKGVTLEGSFELTDDDIVMEMDIPFLLKPFKGKAVQVVEDEINKWVEKAKRGELDDEEARP